MIQCFPFLFHYYFTFIFFFLVLLFVYLFPVHPYAIPFFLHTPPSLYFHSEQHKFQFTFIHLFFVPSLFSLFYHSPLTGLPLENISLSFFSRLVSLISSFSPSFAFLLLAFPFFILLLSLLFSPCLPSLLRASVGLFFSFCSPLQVLELAPLT